jgi:hypothetical protein
MNPHVFIIRHVVIVAINVPVNLFQAVQTDEIS